MKFYNKTIIINRQILAVALFSLLSVSEMVAQPVLNEVKGDNLPVVKRAYRLVDCLQEGLENNYSLKVVKNEQRISDNNAA